MATVGVKGLMTMASC